MNCWNFSVRNRSRCPSIGAAGTAVVEVVMVVVVVVCVVVVVVTVVVVKVVGDIGVTGLLGRFPRRPVLGTPSVRIIRLFGTAIIVPILTGENTGMVVMRTCTWFSAWVCLRQGEKWVTLFLRTQ